MEDLPAGPQVPNANGIVLTCRRQPPSVWAERHADDELRMSRQCEHLATGRHVPEPDYVVGAPGGKVPTIGAEGDVQEGPLGGLAVRVVSRKPEAFPPGCRLPEEHGLAGVG